jgi:hypothetical protein
VIAIHDTSLFACHEHSRSTETRAVPEPPEGPKVVDDAVTEGWQRTFEGEVRFVDVDVELPHAAR